MKFTYLTLVFLIIISGCKPSEKLVEKKDSKQDLINFLFQDYNGEKPSASFIVIKDGKIKECQSFGYADLENKILANCETNYRLASVTKQFTAMAILTLIKQGKLNYKTKLTEIIPEFPEYGKEITIKNLMSHRSGLQAIQQTVSARCRKNNLLIKKCSIILNKARQPFVSGKYQVQVQQFRLCCFSHDNRTGYGQNVSRIYG